MNLKNEKAIDPAGSMAFSLHMNNDVHVLKEINIVHDNRQIVSNIIVRTIVTPYKMKDSS